MCSGATAAPASSSWPRPVTCRSDGRVAPASATRARPVCSTELSATSPSHSRRPPRGTCSCAAHDPTQISPSTCNRRGDRGHRRPSKPCSMGERKVLVDGANRRRSFANGGSDSLRRYGPDVADGEQPRMARLERKRLSCQAFPTPAELLLRERSVREHEAALVEGGALGQPFRRRVGSDEGEQRCTTQCVLSGGARDPDGTELLVAFETGDPGIGPH